MRSDDAQVCYIVLHVWGELVIWTNFSEETEDGVPVERLSEGEDALVLNVGVDYGGDVETRGVADVDEVFCVWFS